LIFTRCPVCPPEDVLPSFTRNVDDDQQFDQSEGDRPTLIPLTGGIPTAGVEGEFFLSAMMFINLSIKKAGTGIDPVPA
jgi:hypothetical protein